MPAATPAPSNSGFALIAAPAAPAGSATCASRPGDRIESTDESAESATAKSKAGGRPRADATPGGESTSACQRNQPSRPSSVGHNRMDPKLAADSRNAPVASTVPAAHRGSSGERAQSVRTGPFRPSTRSSPRSITRERPGGPCQRRKSKLTTDRFEAHPGTRRASKRTKWSRLQPVRIDASSGQRSLGPLCGNSSDPRANGCGMATAGLIGGLGPESTIDYYLRIIEAWQRHDPTSSPSLVIDSLDVQRGLSLVASDRPGLAEYLFGSVRRLAGAGVDFIALTANTGHIVFDELAARSPVPMVSIIEVCADEAKRRGLERLGLLGTRFTMEGAFYPAVFSKRGMGIVPPAEAERLAVHERYAGQLLKGDFLDETRQWIAT